MSKPIPVLTSTSQTDPTSRIGSVDRIELMQTFVRIVEAGSLSAAAIQMATTQPTVSRRLHTLEQTLGLRLLQRSTHVMKLTYDGERCYERAKALLADWDSFEADLRGATTQVDGTLRVVVPHAFGQEKLVKPMAEFLRCHPRIEVEWLLHDDIGDFIAAGIDCAIQVGDVIDPGLVAIKLGEVPRFAVAAPSVLNGAAIPVHPKELATLPWLAIRTFYRNEVTLKHIETGEIQHIAIRPRVSTDNLFALRSAALEGLGACVGSAWVLTDGLASGQLIHLAPQWQATPLPVYLVYPYARFYPERLRRFAELIKAEMAGVIGEPPAMTSTDAQ